MADTTTLPAPELTRSGHALAAWEAERETFFRLLPELLESHRGIYVAVYGGKVVGAGVDQVAVALQAYGEFGYVPIYVGRVAVEPETPVRLPSPRLLPLGESR